MSEFELMSEMLAYNENKKYNKTNVRLMQAKRNHERKKLSNT